MDRDVSALDSERVRYRPRTPAILREPPSKVAFREGADTTSAGQARRIRELFPVTYGRPVVEARAGEGRDPGRALRVGVVLSGGQAPGGHNVIAGLYDALRTAHPESLVVGFRGGPGGIVSGDHVELTAERLAPYRNTGGFDLIGSGRDKIESDAQLAASRETCRRLRLDGLVIVGGDDSNTNAAVLAEYFASRDDGVTVVGVPKTIDGDLKGGGIETSFGFDTATRVYASLVGNICRDAASAGKYWHFIRLMGRSASHVTLECALQTHPNVALIAEEVEARGMTLDRLVDEVADRVRRRADAGLGYGVCLVPEGLIEFLPEMRRLIGELNRILAEPDTGLSAGPGDRIERVAQRLSDESASVLRSLPRAIGEQLLIDRDSHGNVQVSLVETEKLLIEKVASRLDEWRVDGRYRGRFKTQSHFFGYEGRAANPTNFDADYTYSLGRLASLLVGAGRTGYVCAVGNLAEAPERWIARGVPLTGLMQIEERKGREVPVIRKALVRTAAAPFRTFATLRDGWVERDDYRYCGAIQYFGPARVSRQPTQTLLLEHTGTLDVPSWLGDA